MAAVTAEPVAVSGCDVLLLGLLRYRATASPAFVERYLAAGVDHEVLATAPMLVFNTKDVLETLEAGRLVELIPDSPLDSPLYWQSPSLMREALFDLTAAVQETARTVLIHAVC